MNLRILLADDHEIFRSGLRGLLERQPCMTVVAEVENGLQAIEAALAQRPDVAVLDLTMPLMGGIEATRKISEMLPEVKILCLSIHKDREFVLAVLHAGARGYLVKDCALEELVLALDVVMKEQVYLSPSISALVLEASKTHPDAAGASGSSLLTLREQEVLLDIAEGRSTSEIATQRFISTKTVGTHRRNLMDKLDIHTVAGLTKYAIRKGLTSAAP